MSITTDADGLTDAEERQGLEKLLHIYRGNLQYLEEQAAKQADNVPLGTHNGIADAREQIKRIEEQIKQLAPQPRLASEHRVDILPTPLTILVGREQDIGKALQNLRRPEIRLLTLAGSAGVGKTRLGIEIARQLREDFENGVAFVDLAPITDPKLVLTSIATTLSVTESGDQQLAEELKDFLRERHMLLVLDNFEHLIEAAQSVADLLAYAPRLKLLVTSREILNVEGELPFPVPPLALPHMLDLQPERIQSEDGLQKLTQYAAVLLFIQRAQTARSTFKLTDENAQLIAQICTRLDGLPLAIELAAAGIKTKSTQEVLSGIGHRFQSLTKGSRDAQPRQRSLQAAIDWSYHLLNPSQQALFIQLAVFAGGMTLEAAMSVCGGRSKQDYQSFGSTTPASMLIAQPLEDAIVENDFTALVDKSLLQPAEIGHDTPRFFMLETIHEYALERLAETQAENQLRQRHGEYFLKLAEETEPKLTATNNEAELQQLEDEHANLRFVLQWALKQARSDIAMRLSGALWRFWYARGYLSEGRAWLDQALALPPTTEEATRAKALHGVGALAHAQCDYTRAIECYEESLALRRKLDDKSNIARLLNNLGLVAREQADYTTARARLEQSLAVWRQIGDRWGMIGALSNLGMVADDQGNFATARKFHEQSLKLELAMGDDWAVAETRNNLGLTLLHQDNLMEAQASFEQSLTFFRKLEDDRQIANCVANLGLVALAQRDYLRAATLYIESLSILCELGDKRSIAECLEGIAGILGAQKQPEQAARLWGAAEALRKAIRTPLPPAEHARYDRLVAEARAEADQGLWEAAWKSGQTIGQADIVAIAIAQANLIVRT